MLAFSLASKLRLGIVGARSRSSVPVLRVRKCFGPARWNGKHPGMVGAALLAMALLAAPASSATLYADLGEQPGLTRIVEDLLHRAFADPRIQASLQDANIERLQGLLVLQFCKLTDGPCLYPGHDMRTSHADLQLRPRHFNALVEHLQSAMDANGVPFRTQNRLLAPMHRDIVTP